MTIETKLQTNMHFSSDFNMHLSTMTLTTERL